MIISTFLSVLAIGASPAPHIFTGEMVGYDRRQEQTTRWERFDLRLTNNTDKPQSLGACTKDTDMVLKTPQGSTTSAFALKLDDEDWSFDCVEREVAPGESTTLGMYFRPAFQARASRYISLKTDKGAFLINP